MLTRSGHDDVVHDKTAQRGAGNEDKKSSKSTTTHFVSRTASVCDMLEEAMVHRRTWGGNAHDRLLM